jgi:hypothetical protein
MTAHRSKALAEGAGSAVAILLSANIIHPTSGEIVAHFPEVTNVRFGSGSVIYSRMAYVRFAPVAD